MPDFSLAAGWHPVAFKKSIKYFAECKFMQVGGGKKSSAGAPPFESGVLMYARHVLFLCSQNRLRSPTAEQVFADWPGVETASAGVLADADVPVSPELLQWADVIFVMERAHRTRLARRYRQWLNGKRVICLDIPDDYDFMAPALVELLKRKVAPHL